jgi:hypothetical protein
MTMKPTLVHSQSKDDVALERVETIANQALCELAANLLRVIRGAGAPDSIYGQAFDFCKGVSEFYQLSGKIPDGKTHARALDVSKDVNSETYRSCDVASKMMLLAEEEMVQGALQIVASRLVGQSTQESKGENELFSGVAHRDDAIDMVNK